jgi:hypothetical protein
MSIDPLAIERLKRWRTHGDGPITYTAGSKQFSDDVIVLLIENDRLRAVLQVIAGCQKRADGDLVDLARRALSSAEGNEA